MNKFTYQSPTKIHFGEGQIAEIANDIPKDKKILVVYGGGSIKTNGVYEQVAAALTGFNWGEFSGVESNPQYDTLMQAVAKVKAEGYDFLLAVGGGSVVDGTKFIAAAACYEGADPWEILHDQAPVITTLPIGCVLTLPATGSETNGGSVVSRGKDKLFFGSPLVKPTFAILDPQTTLSLSPRQVSNGVVDAFVHTMEQYLTFPVNAKVQDRFAEGLLLTLIEEGPKALATPDDIAVRANIMWSATQALNGLIGVGVPQDWTTHMIGHELTGNYSIDHARTLSIVLPAVMQVCRKEKQAKLVQYAERVFGITTGTTDERIDAAIAHTIAFFKEMDVPTSLADVELGAADIDVLIASLEKHGRTALGEHGKLTIADSRKILETAL
ncbi:NADH-dependent alcohol dehydrogenase [Photobacterium phosphoreum]|uniref:NADH-dependent alcohol dehydrogenase n=1 Tax=Photobacterium phosphoreum TaxID=659 RepID=A0A2T3JJZ5_PHOPO|nr:iron-containing alcohol dehydrogenase [Photobacterium phosphoreum]PSU23562.1 NADH-dependent alcohol dehydrogenase [Photobacterium phosphoreum]PSU41729.1 NADH-dependent alcohol dehydrogenase [Photobacterium phosphoreum]PSU49326.1 NADH-dependent alcohol dehydrogenase [Photobacterium phosphoreum]